MSARGIPNFRPYARIRKHIWRDQNGQEVPGIALYHGERIVIHMTPAEALQIADKLVDLAERIEA